MKNIILTMALVISSFVYAQVKIGDNVATLNANSLLELESTNKGVLFPRVALTGTTDATTVGTQVAGMTVYNTAATSDVTVGMYTSNGTKWLRLVADSATSLNVTAEQTGNYTALATDDIILTNYTTGSLWITLPTSGIPIGKKYYISNIGNNNVNFTNTLRGGAVAVIPAFMSGILMYVRNTVSGSWTIVSTQ